MMDFPDDPISRMFQNAQPAVNAFDSHTSALVRECELMDRRCREAEAAFPRMLDSMDAVHQMIQKAEATMSLPRLADSLIGIQQELSTRLFEQQQRFVPLVNDMVLRQIEFERTAFGSFERIARETALQEGLANSLMAACRTLPADVIPIATGCSDLLDTIMSGFEEIGIGSSETDYETIIWRFEHWLATFPPNILMIVISLITNLIVGLAINQQGAHSCKCESKALPEAHQSQTSRVEKKGDDANFNDMCQ